MTTTQIRFDDGAAYERYMGKWSQLVGESFLQWLAPAVELRWLDVGCGGGAFTELITQRCAPKTIHGVDPAAGQLHYARTRLPAPLATFCQGDAMALPFPENYFDIAVMPLVIFFVPEPSQGVAEMARVVCPGGTVCAYGWDLIGGGFPYEVLHSEIRNMGLAVPTPPNPEAAQVDILVELWSRAGLHSIETQEITVERTYADFEDYWLTILGAPSAGSQLAALSSGDIEHLQARLCDRLNVVSNRPIVCSARAHAVRGTV